MMSTEPCPFEGMTEDESIDYQLQRWVEGVYLHNPIRDECCPDFACCNENMRTPYEARVRFAGASREDQSKMLGMFLGGVVADEGVNAHVVDGTAPEAH